MRVALQKREEKEKEGKREEERKREKRKGRERMKKKERKREKEGEREKIYLRICYGYCTFDQCNNSPAPGSIVVESDCVAWVWTRRKGHGVHSAVVEKKEDYTIWVPDRSPLFRWISDYVTALESCWCRTDHNIRKFDAWYDSSLSGLKIEVQQLYLPISQQSWRGTSNWWQLKAPRQWQRLHR